jgi:glycerol-3-phosphate acyltransferase PlsY
VYALIFLIWRLSALGSLFAVFSYPVWMILVYQVESRWLWAFSIMVPVLVIITHRSNIERLLKGKEKPLSKN